MGGTETADAAAGRASALNDLGRHRDAVVLARQALAADPQNVRAWGELARAELGNGNPEAALSAARAAFAVDPAADWPPRLASIALGRLDQPDHALGAAREAIRLAPFSWQNQVTLARALVNLDQHDAARAAIESALAAGPLQAEVHVAAASVALAGGQLTEARQHAERALALEPTNSSALNELARITLRQRTGFSPGVLAGAADGFVSALRAAPGVPVFRRNLDLVVQLFLARVAYFVFLDVCVAWDLWSGIAVRVATVMLLAVPITFAVRFVYALSAPMRAHLSSVLHRRRVLPALLLVLAAATLLTAGCVTGQRGLVSGAAGTAVAGRVALRLGRGGSVRGLARRLSNGALWLIALAFGLFAALALTTLGGPDPDKDAAAGFGAFFALGAVGTVLVLARRRRARRHRERTVAW